MPAKPPVIRRISWAITTQFRNRTGDLVIGGRVNADPGSGDRVIV